MDNFKEYMTERMDKSIQSKLKKLETLKTIKTNPRTQSLWYSPNTEYDIEFVDDGHYNDKPGIKTSGGFIPLGDLNV